MFVSLAIGAYFIAFELDEGFESLSVLSGAIIAPSGTARHNRVVVNDEIRLVFTWHRDSTKAPDVGEAWTDVIGGRGGDEDR